MSHFHCFVIVFKLISMFLFDDALMELGSHFANLTFSVSCNRNCT